jgi:hypothetical protein
MPNAVELLQHGRKEEVWTKFCGYLDLDLDEFMEIQERLLLEQVQLLHESVIGKKLLGKKAPTNLEEFRKQVPLTTYEDYAEFIGERNEDSLPSGSYDWAHTSGRSGVHTFKWAPYSKRMYDRLGEVVVGAMILASCSRRGEVEVEAGDAILLATAPPPYISGLLSYSTEEIGKFKFLPSLELGDKMPFVDRIADGFSLAMEEGLDYFYGLASVLSKMGERFENGSGNVIMSARMLRPRTLFRMVKGFLCAKLNGRPMFPKDMWNLKGIMTGGTDTAIYRDKIEHYWGKFPLEGYACTEGGMMAMQAWNFKGMTFFPDNDFIEFIPFDQHLKNKTDPSFIPETKMLNELETGIYELVFTNLLGGVFTRYRVGDLFEVIALRDDELGIDLPQFRFYSRINDLIDLGGFARLNERYIWQAIENSGAAYEEWIARKESQNGDLVLHLYIELKDKNEMPAEQIESSIHENLCELVPEYGDLETLLGGVSLKLSLLPAGTWARYMAERQREGADLAHIKPPHIQPSDFVMDNIQLASQG